MYSSGTHTLFPSPHGPSRSEGTPGGSAFIGTPQIPITRQCIITSKDNPGSDPAVSSPILEVTQSGQVSAPPAGATVIISEVMANPCGSIEVRKWNEYVELYNYGGQPVDVGGWWLADTGMAGAGTPDQLVAWSQRNPN